MSTSLKNATHLNKKIYTKTKLNNTLGKIEKIEFSSDSHQPCTLDKKRVLHSTHSGSPREQFKKIFLPLLIDILELRQSIDNFNLSSCNNVFSTIGKRAKSPEQVLSELEHLQNQIEESRRWHDGVILQIERGIQEARENLTKKPEVQEKNMGWLKKLTKLLKVK